MVLITFLCVCACVSVGVFEADVARSLSAAEVALLRVKHLQWLPVLESSFSVNVSYNGNSDETIPDDKGQHGLCARLLFRCVFDVSICSATHHV